MDLPKPSSHENPTRSQNKEVKLPPAREGDEGGMEEQEDDDELKDEPLTSACSCEFIKVEDGSL